MAARSAWRGRQRGRGGPRCDSRPRGSCCVRGLSNARFACSTLDIRVFALQAQQRASQDERADPDAGASSSTRVLSLRQSVTAFGAHKLCFVLATVPCACLRLASGAARQTPSSAFSASLRLLQSDQQHTAYHSTARAAARDSREARLSLCSRRPWCRAARHVDGIIHKECPVTLEPCVMRCLRRDAGTVAKPGMCRSAAQHSWALQWWLYSAMRQSLCS